MKCEICGSKKGCAIYKNDPWCSGICREKWEEKHRVKEWW